MLPLVACDRSKPDFEIGYTDLLVWSNDVYWLDNKTIVFVGAEKLPGSVRFPLEKAHIYIWRLGKEPVAYKPDLWPSPEPVRDSSRDYVCAAEGKIYYSTKSRVPLTHTYGWTIPIMVGKLGHEHSETLIYDEGNNGINPPESSKIVGKRCERYRSSEMIDHVWSVSYSRRFVLDFGKFHRGAVKPVVVPVGRPLRLLNIASHQITPVPEVDGNQVTGTCTHAPSWEETFIVWRCQVGDDTRAATSFPVWRIHADGRTERTALHIDDLWGVHLVPSRAGYFAAVDGVKSIEGANSAKAGFYAVLANGDLKQLLNGHYTAKAVSPNGCLGAFAQATAFGTTDTEEHLAIFDLCKIRRN